MRRHWLSDRDTRDAFQVVATFSLIILSALLYIAETALLIGVFVVGFLMIFDRGYLPLFDQWLVAAILYIVYRVAMLTRRARVGSAIMMVMIPVRSSLDPGLAEGFGAGFPALRLPPVDGDPLRLPLMIGHGR